MSATVEPGGTTLVTPMTFCLISYWTFVDFIAVVSLVDSAASTLRGPDPKLAFSDASVSVFSSLVSDRKLKVAMYSLPVVISLT
jgi:hypothetical protein